MIHFILVVESTKDTKTKISDMCILSRFTYFSSVPTYFYANVKMRSPFTQTLLQTMYLNLQSDRINPIRKRRDMIDVHEPFTELKNWKSKD